MVVSLGSLAFFQLQFRTQGDPGVWVFAVLVGLVVLFGLGMTRRAHLRRFQWFPKDGVLIAALGDSSHLDDEYFYIGANRQIASIGAEGEKSGTHSVDRIFMRATASGRLREIRLGSDDSWNPCREVLRGRRVKRIGFERDEGSRSSDDGG